MNQFDASIFFKPETWKWLGEKTREEGFASEGECVAALTQKAREADAVENALLDRLIQEGLDSGPGTELTRRDWEDMHRDLREKYGASVED